MPIFDYKGQRTGVVARFLEELKEDVIPINVQSKALIYWEKEKILPLHIPLTECDKILDEDGNETFCIVEDIPSAVSVQSMGVPCVALLGTNIPKDSLSWFYNKNVVFCLDPDATDTALNYQKQYNLLFNMCQVFNMPKDPKNMTPKEIYKYITGRIS